MGVSAVCVLVGQIFGTIMFQQESPTAMVHIKGEIENLSEGNHGFHVHAFGDVRQGCLNASSHYNPFNKDHGGPDDEDRHVGDLGNIVAGSSGVALIDMTDKLIQLQGEHSVIGRAIVVHSKQDDLGRGGDAESKKTGNAGARLNCCVIGYAE